MAIRLEKSGDLYLIRGRADPPVKQQRRNLHLGLWLVLAGLVLVMVYAPALQSQWPAVSHAIQTFLAAVW